MSAAVRKNLLWRQASLPDGLGTLLIVLAITLSSAHAAGEVDTSFGENGLAATTLLPDLPGVRANSAVVLPDGRIVVGGTAIVTFTESEIVLAAYLPDGTLDTSFGSDGIVRPDYPEMDDQLASMTVTRDGNIVIVGIAEIAVADQDLLIGMFSPSGDPVESFGEGGAVRRDVTDFRDSARAVAAHPDGGIVLAAAFVPDESNLLDRDFAVLKYLADGTPDPNFGVDGLVITDFGNFEDEATAVAVQDDGRIIVAGGAGFERDFSDIGFRSDFGLVRYLPDGSLDPSFGDDGRVRTPVQFRSRIVDVILTENGNIIVIGESQTELLQRVVALAFYRADGTLDTARGDAGVLLLESFSDFPFACGRCLLQQADGGILVGVNDVTTPESGVIALNADGTIDRAFGVDGYGRHGTFVEQRATVIAGERIVSAGFDVRPGEGFERIALTALTGGVTAETVFFSGFEGGEAAK
ncbi:MAG: delta-60 repeat domain-containing protein [Pseudomonadota bacterium]